MQKNTQEYRRRKIYTKILAHPKTLGRYRNNGAFKIFGGCQNIGASKIFGGCQNLGASKIFGAYRNVGVQEKLGARQCWRSRKSRQTRWRIALLFRLGRICNCSLLSGPSDGLVLFLSDVLNRIHVDSKWGMVPQCLAFMGRLSPVLYQLLVPARHASKWSNLWHRPNLWCPPEISLISVKPQQSLSLFIGVL